MAAGKIGRANSAFFKSYGKFGATPVEVGIVYLLLAASTAAVLLPFLHEIAKSFSHPNDVEAGRVLLFPLRPTLGNYRYFLQPEFNALPRAFVNNLFITAFGTLWSVFFTALTAFPVSRPRKEFPAGKGVMALVIFSIVFAPPMIPYFLAVRSYGLIDSWWSLFLPHTVLPFNMTLVVSYYRGLPEELFEACRIDGGGDLRMAFNIAMPLSKPILATVGIYTAVVFWNMFLHPLLFIRSQDLMPLQVFVRSILADAADMAGQDASLNLFSNSQSSKSALVMLTTAPIVLVYPFMQRHFIKGSLSGALKS